MKTFFELIEAVQEKTLTPAEKKKREEIARAMERDDPGMDMSKKMAIATAQAKKVAEGVIPHAVKDQLGNIDWSIRDWEKRWKNKSAGNPNDMKAPQKIKDLKAQKAALMKKHGIKEEAELDEGKKGVVLAFKDQYKSRAGATDDGQRQMKKLGGSSFTVYQSSNGLWAYKIFEGVEDLDEAGPKMKPDFVKTQRAKDAAHNAAMGRTATGRKKPVRTMTSTQRSMASMKKEEAELDEGISNLSHSRLKYHATKGVSHGRYSTAEIKDEHKRRLRSEPDYVKAKASMNEAIAAKPDATEVIRKKKQMAAISTSDKDKLSKIAQMMKNANK